MKRILFSLLISIFLSPVISAQSSPKKDKHRKSKETIKEEKKEEDKYADITKKCVKAEGLFTLWRDTVSGKVYLEVREEQIDKDFIYFNHILDAPIEAGYFRGSYGASKIVRFHRAFDRMEIWQDNTNFYYDPASELSKAAGANINDPVLVSEKIEAVSKDKKVYLVDGDAIFLSEKLQIVKFPAPQGATPGPLGTLSVGKTHVDRINNYPQNTEVSVSFIYENPAPTLSSESIADSRNITIKYQHSILEMPSNNFQPRYDDPRIGYFATQVNDMTSFSPTPYRDVIHRWHLEKKDPAATLSEPIKPITFYIENTTPKEFRPLIKEAAERWNVAFEGAGFKNALVCLEQPDDANWDAGDVRYNVLRWVSSPAPPFGGYGPSFVNPRTGQILGADIMLEFVAIVNRVNAEKIFKSTGFLNDESLVQENKDFVRNPFLCMASQQTNHDVMFGSTASAILGMSEVTQKEIVQQMLYRLVLHEIGHTLGLTHNMRASTMSSMADVKNKAKVEKDGLANSIMEYPAFNYQLNPAEQTIYCDTKPGVYDHWAIQYGYSAAVADKTQEAARLKKITDRSTEPNLMYGNDADDMRTSGHGIDPDVNIYDLTNDPVAYAKERCELVNTILPKLKSRFEKQDQSYEELLQAYYILSGEYANQIRIMTRQIGGVHYDRSFISQAAGIRPLEPVSEGKQKAAMSAVAKYAFAPNAWAAGIAAYNYLLAQRRGFDHFSVNEDPHIHQRILAMQKECLNQLMHENVWQRITDSQQYGNTYTLDQVITDLTNSIFQSDLKSSVNTFRQNLQVEYVQRLIAVNDVKSKYDHVSKSMSSYELKRIDGLMSSATMGDLPTKAHRDFIRSLIKKYFEGK